MKELLKRGCYLYSIADNKFTVRQGDVYVYPYITRNDEAGFTVGHKVINCSLEPGLVHNGCVWFEVESDQAAKLTLAEYEKWLIYDLEKKINAHYRLLDIIKGGLQNENEDVTEEDIIKFTSDFITANGLKVDDRTHRQLCKDFSKGVIK